MSTLDDWIAEAAEALSLTPATITVDLRNSLLELTRDVAHGVARVGGPLTCYLVGLAVANGAAPSTAVSTLRELVAARRNNEPEPEPDSPPGAGPKSVPTPEPEVEAGSSPSPGLGR